MSNSVKEALIALEKQGWEAWKKRDGKVFQDLLIDESISVSASGVEDKATVIKNGSSSDCEIKSYSLDNFRLVMLDPNTAILTFKGNQDATCKGKALPTTVWASSVYVKRGGKWLNAFYQESAADATQ